MLSLSILLYSFPLHPSSSHFYSFRVNEPCEDWISCDMSLATPKNSKTSKKKRQLCRNPKYENISCVVEVITQISSVAWHCSLSLLLCGTCLKWSQLLLQFISIARLEKPAEVWNLGNAEPQQEHKLVKVVVLLLSKAQNNSRREVLHPEESNIYCPFPVLF